MGDYLRKSTYCMPQGTRLVYFTPSTSAIVPGLSFSRSYPDSRVFLQLPRFSSHLKIDSQLKYIWLQCCAPRSYMDSIVAATSTPYMFSTWSQRAAPLSHQEDFRNFVFFLFPLDWSRKTSFRLFVDKRAGRGCQTPLKDILREP